MALPFDHPSLHLQVILGAFFVYKHRPDDPPSTDLIACLGAAKSVTFLSVTRTKDEISVAGEWTDESPIEYKNESTWGCIKIAGPMEFSKTCYKPDLRPLTFHWRRSDRCDCDLYSPIEGGERSSVRYVHMVRLSLNLVYLDNIDIPRLSQEYRLHYDTKRQARSGCKRAKE
jgi:hypothetical protein